MKPICDEETAYPLTYPFGLHFYNINLLVFAIIEQQED